MVVVVTVEGTTVVVLVAVGGKPSAVMVVVLVEGHLVVFWTDTTIRTQTGAMRLTEQRRPHHSLRPTRRKAKTLSTIASTAATITAAPVQVVALSVPLYLSPTNLALVPYKMPPSSCRYYISPILT